MKKRLGAVIIFREGVTREKAEAMLRGMEDAEVVEGSHWVGGKTPVEEFNPEWGGPVWYIP